MPDTAAVDQVFPETSLSPPPSNEASTGPTATAIDGVVCNDDDIFGSDGQREKLIMWQGIALLTADCMGVGILGLPNDMKVLGWTVGLSFLVLNCPINYYAGCLLSVLATNIETNDDSKTLSNADANATEVELTTAGIQSTKNPSFVGGGDAIDAPVIRRRFSNKKNSYRGIPQNQKADAIASATNGGDHDEEYDVVTSNCDDAIDSSCVGEEDGVSEGLFQDELVPDGVDGIQEQGNVPPGFQSLHRSNTNTLDRKTSDLINITAAVFAPNDTLTSRIYILMVEIIYYLSLFLVLGDYMLVMGRSVAAFFGEDNICLPTAGAVASVLMFGLCQFRTMANLGRSVSLASLFALLIVLVQCLFHHHRNSTGTNDNSTDTPLTRNLLNGDDDVVTTDEDNGIWGKFSSLAGVGFAVCSQKLFLNIRHELKHRNEASRVLAGSLFTYGFVYVVVVLLAGPDPPSFLFDAIPEGWGRRFAGLLLWFHVAVSYAINSQALCASLDHMLPVPTSSGVVRSNAAVRWFGITLVVSLSSYIVSNAVPFFKDLVALIGALASVPLSLMLPAILHRRAKNIALLLPDRYCPSPDSYLLILYSFFFLVIGLAGALFDIDEDWLSKGKPFACH
mmetsp:Transcript_301/g.609  ORF Transcript_301/g.609 Transcript_301/m.609 type:complete len:621 (-) Transcript_301:141-2003(-)